MQLINEIVYLCLSVCGVCININSQHKLAVFLLFQQYSGACEGTRACAQCLAWGTGEKKEKEECDKCTFTIEKVDELKKRKDA